MQAIFVDRKSSKSRRLAAEEIMRRASGPGWPRWGPSWSRWWWWSWPPSSKVLLLKSEEKPGWLDNNWNKGADLSRGYHDWRHRPYPLQVILSFSTNTQFPISIKIHFFVTQSVDPQGWSFQRREACPTSGSTPSQSSFPKSSEILNPTDPFLSSSGGNLLWGNQWCHLDQGLIVHVLGWLDDNVDDDDQDKKEDNTDFYDLQSWHAFERWLLTPWPPCTPLLLPPSSLL